MHGELDHETTRRGGAPMKIAMLMGSEKDMPKMQAGVDVLTEFGV